MRRFLVGLLATVGALALLVLIGSVAAVWWWVGDFDEADPLPERIVLTVGLHGQLDEGSPSDPLAGLLPGETGLGLVDIVDALDRAALDPRVTAAIFDLSGAELGLAQTQELRAAVFRFRAAGKTALAFADSYEGNGVGPYYLASAFDRIWMQPSGLLALTGISMEFPLARGLLEEIGLQPEFEQRFEFKGAMTAFTESAMPQPIRDNYTRVADSLYGQIVSGIASTRRLGGPTVSALIDRGPLLAEEARGNGLVDSLGYRTDVEETVGATVETRVDAANYLAAAGRPHAEGARIALIHLDGLIDRGNGGGIGGATGTGSAHMADVIDEVLEDGNVRGVILRISSPGGSYVASDTIRHELERLRAAGLPVVASFADVAASGGYFAALPADHILAHPGTLTGSIGTVGGKINARELLEKLDVEVERIEIGRNAGMFSLTRPFTPSQRDHLRRILDAVYADFTAKVALARQLSATEIDAVARGRIWTGEDARRAGLVDALGGYAEAMQLARQSIGIAPDAPVERVRFPRDEDPFELVMEVLRSGDIHQTLTKMRDIIGRVETVMRVLPARGSGVVSAEAPAVPRMR